MKQKSVLPLLLAILVFQARPADRFALTIDNIMRGPALVGYEPAQVRWSFDSQRLIFQWKQASDKPDAPMDTYTANRDGSGLRKLTDEEVKALPLPGDTSKDKRLTVYSRDGDIFLYDNTNGKIQQVTKTTDMESNPHFLPDGKRIYFTRANNLYVQSLETGFLEQMTDIRPAPAAGAAATPTAGTGGGGRGQGGGRGGGRGGGGGRGDGAAAGGTTGEAQAPAPARILSRRNRRNSSKRFATARRAAKKTTPRRRKNRSASPSPCRPVRRRAGCNSRRTASTWWPRSSKPAPPRAAWCLRGSPIADTWRTSRAVRTWAMRRGIPDWR